MLKNKKNKKKVNFKNGRVEDYTIILSNKALHHLGQLTGITEIKYGGNLNGANVLSFVVNKVDLIPVDNMLYKNITSYQNYIWKNLVDFKTIYVKELDEYFEIKVSLDDSQETKKTINATSLCEAELSNVNLYNFNINTEEDLEDKDYITTTFYNDKETKYSLLHRMLRKVPQYKIGHVDKSLCDIQRTFSVDGTSIYDFMTGECSEQFDCLFQFDSATRTVSVYDLMSVCNECGKRDDFNDMCPECGSDDIQKQFGEDTTIYVDKTNLTDAIQFEMDGDQVKNCFKLEAGDEYMNDTIKSLNPNGTDYLYIIREDDRNDMPAELVAELDRYSEDVSNAEAEIKELTKQQYDLWDKYHYYYDYMMPSIETDLKEAPSVETIEEPKEGTIYMYGDVAYLYVDGSFVPQSVEDTKFLLELAPLYETVTVDTEVKKLTSDILNPIGIKTSSMHKALSLSTVNNAVKNYAKLFVNTGYVKLEIEDSNTDPNIKFELNMNEDGTDLAEDENGYHSGNWYGRIKVIDVSDKEKFVYTGYMNITITDDYETFLTQYMYKTFGEDDEEGSVFDVLSIDNMEHFKKALTLYNWNSLKSFYNIIDGVLKDLSTKEIAQPNDSNSELNLLYEELYLPYQDKLALCSTQMEIMQEKIAVIESEMEVLNNRRQEIQDDLNLEERLRDLYPIFCSYKREDKYSNSNYISDGLDNTQMIERAEEFWELARKEIDKSANGQYNLSSTLYNLLAMEEFQPIVEYFELGNWIRVKVDGQLYTLRLIGYEIDFDNLQNINVTFSTATKVKSLKQKRDDVLNSAASIAKNFSYVSKQAESGQEANNNMNSIIKNGLDSSLVTIKNNNNEEVTYGNYGILLKEYDDVLGDYTDNQCLLTHNAMVYTTDGWGTASQAIGEHRYTYYNNETNQFDTTIGYGLTAQFCEAAYVYGGQIIGSEIYSTDYNPNEGIGSHISLVGRGSFNFGNVLKFNGVDSELSVSGTINAKDGYFEKGYIGSDDYDYKWTIGNDKDRAYIYNGTDSMTSISIGTYLGTDGFRNYKSDSIYVNISNGVLDCVGAKLSEAEISGNYLLYNEYGGKAIEMANHHINVYGFWENASDEVIGTIGSVPKTGSGTGEGAIAMIAQNDNSVVLGYLEDNAYTSGVIYFNKANIEAGHTPGIANTYTGTIFNKHTGIVVENGLIKSWGLDTSSGTVSFISGINWSYNDNCVTSINSITRTTLEVKNGLIVGWSSSTTEY